MEPGSQGGIYDEMVSITNRLQDVFATIGTSTSVIDLPQICVIGGQSSDKICVLDVTRGSFFAQRPGH